MNSQDDLQGLFESRKSQVSIYYISKYHNDFVSLSNNVNLP